MNSSTVSRLANEVSAMKDALRNSLILKKCREQSILQGRLVKPKEITLSEPEKDRMMPRALLLIHSNYPKEDKKLFFQLVGTELSKRKQARRHEEEALLASLLAETEEQECRSESFADNYAVKESAQQQYIEELVRANIVMLSDEGDMIILL